MSKGNVIVAIIVILGVLAMIGKTVYTAGFKAGAEDCIKKTEVYWPVEEGKGEYIILRYGHQANYHYVPVEEEP